MKQLTQVQSKTIFPLIIRNVLVCPLMVGLILANISFVDTNYKILVYNPYLYIQILQLYLLGFYFFKPRHKLW